MVSPIEQHIGRALGAAHDGQPLHHVRALAQQRAHPSNRHHLDVMQRAPAASALEPFDHLELVPLSSDLFGAQDAAERRNGHAAARAVRGQQLHARQVAHDACNEEGCRPRAGGVVRTPSQLDRRTRLEQQPRALDVAVLAAEEQGSVAVRVGRVRRRAAREQHAHARCVALHARELQGSGARAWGLPVDGDIRSEEQRDDRGVPLLRSDGQRHIAHRIGLVGLCARQEKLLAADGVASQCRRVDRSDALPGFFWLEQEGVVRAGRARQKEFHVGERAVACCDDQRFSALHQAGYRCAHPI